MTAFGAERIAAAAAEALSLVGAMPGRHPSVITPLKEVVAAYGLAVEEVDGLSPVSAAARLAAEGLRGAAPTTGAQPLSGYLYANAAGGIVLVNRDGHNPLVRRRYTIAHEVGHYVLHFLPKLTLDGDAAAEITETIAVGQEEEETSGTLLLEASATAAVQPTSDEAERREREAEAFAAALLMPSALVESQLRRYGARAEESPELLARRLAPVFLVSAGAMRRRLQELMA